MTKLAGKSALVLGGSRGIGAATVRRLVSDGARATFTYHGSKDAADALATETGAAAVQANSADRSAVKSVIDSKGPFDILVVSAGVVVIGPALEHEADAIDHMIDVNVRSPYHAAIDVARTMPNDGRIIVIGSVNGDRMPFAGGAAYAMTKAAIQGMVQGLARDFGDRAITVNNVQPGPVDTEMNPADGPMAETMHSFMAMKRHARADEIAGMVSYLAGPEAAMVTGANLTIDGGFGA
ncbi:MAG: SDR family oxidoreductase [Pseudomonadota bacterium]